MKSLLDTIDIGWRSSNFTINNKTIKITYKTGMPHKPAEHIWLSDIVAANHIQPINDTLCYEYGIGYISSILKESGYNIDTIQAPDVLYTNIILAHESFLTIDILTKWNKKGKIYIIVDGEVSIPLLTFANSNGLLYNINQKASIIGASNGNTSEYKISIVEMFKLDISCIYRSLNPIRSEVCESCNNSKIEIQIYKCEKYGECCTNGTKFRSCVTCVDRISNET
jgi:hypothetical protein